MHHANLYVGKNEWALSLLPPNLQTPSVDVLHKVYERMSIADVRTLIYEAQMRPVEREFRAFVVMTNVLLGEAQNALLKLFEEPNAHTVFYLIIPREDMLLPTLRSRLLLAGTEEEGVENHSFDSFKALSYAERLKSIATHLDLDDAVWLSDIVRGMSQEAHTRKEISLIKDTLLLESYIYANGSAKKMLLEHVALSL